MALANSGATGSEVASGGGVVKKLEGGLWCQVEVAMKGIGE